jgi:hypothetical protein
MRMTEERSEMMFTVGYSAYIVAEYINILH